MHRRRPHARSHRTAWARAGAARTAHAHAGPTWEQFVSSLNPVRELEPGERPREWGLEVESREDCPQDAGGDAPGADPTITDSTIPDSTIPASTITDSSGVGNDPMHAPARVAHDQSWDPAGPERFKVQFTATEEYVRLVQEAKALLSHRAPRVTLEEVQLRAMRAFVEALRKRKYGSKEPSGSTTGDGTAFDAGWTKKHPGTRHRSAPMPKPRRIRPLAPERRRTRAGADVTSRRPFGVPSPRAMLSAAPTSTLPVGDARKRSVSSFITSCPLRSVARTRSRMSPCGARPTTL